MENDVSLTRRVVKRSSPIQIDLIVSLNKNVKERDTKIVELHQTNEYHKISKLEKSVQ